MSDKKFVEVCVGIGMNQFFPEYALIEIPNDEVEEVNEKERTFNLKIINKNGTPTIQSISVDPSTNELFTIIDNLKQSKNVVDVKVLDEEVRGN